MLDNFVISPVDGGRAWKYAVHGDARELVAVSARQYPRREDCDAAIAELFNRYEFAMTVRQRHDGQWSWELSKAGRPLLVSPRTHSSPKSCGYAIRRIKRLIDDLARTTGPTR
jgi:hypothetical protein